MLPNSVITALDYLRKPTGLINKSIVSLFSTINFQSVCQFEVIFIQKYTKDTTASKSAPQGEAVSSISKITNAIGTAIGKVNYSAILDQAIATFLVDSVNVSFSAFEYERRANKNYPINITHPEEITITFLETEMGTVRTWIDTWQDEIFYVDDEKIIFKNNQEASKKECWIIPQTRMGLPTFAFKISGMKLKQLQDIELNQGDGNPMRLTVSFAVDSVWLMRLADFI